MYLDFFKEVKLVVEDITFVVFAAVVEAGQLSVRHLDTLLNMTFSFFFWDRNQCAYSP